MYSVLAYPIPSWLPAAPSSILTLSGQHRRTVLWFPPERPVPVPRSHTSPRSAKGLRCILASRYIHSSSTGGWGAEHGLDALRCSRCSSCPTCLFRCLICRCVSCGSAWLFHVQDPRHLVLELQHRHETAPGLHTCSNMGLQPRRALCKRAIGRLLICICVWIFPAFFD
jgi:hypothetical protein